LLGRDGSTNLRELTSREHIIALEPLDKGLMGTLLRYPYEVRDEKEYFDEIQDVKVTKDKRLRAFLLRGNVVFEKLGASIEISDECTDPGYFPWNVHNLLL
jgi:hypothetical protein